MAALAASDAHDARQACLTASYPDCSSARWPATSQSLRQFGDCHAKSPRNDRDVAKRDVSLPSLDSAHIGPIELASLSEVLLGKARLLTKLPHALPEANENVGFFGHGRKATDAEDYVSTDYEYQRKRPAGYGLLHGPFGSAMRGCKDYSAAFSRRLILKTPPLRAMQKGRKPNTWNETARRKNDLLTKLAEPGWS